jgi:hypothetical protein
MAHEEEKWAYIREARENGSIINTVNGPINNILNGPIINILNGPITNPLNARVACASDSIIHRFHCTSLTLHSSCVFLNRR